MTNFKRQLTGMTVMAMALSLQSTTALAQPYDALSGIIIPPCGGGAQEVDGGTLEADAFDGGAIAPDLVLGAVARGEVCISAEGRLELSGESAVMAGGDAIAEPTEEPAAELAQAEGPAAEPPVEPAEPAATVESLSEDLQNQGDATGEAVVEVPAEPTSEPTAEVQPEPAEPSEPAESAAEAPEADQAPAAEAEETVTAPAEEATPELQMPVAAAAGDDGRDQEPAQVEETVVTEENSRSSSEEFQPQQDAAAPAPGKKGGLSNLEKFAIGAAGIVALEAIIGNNREVVSNSGDRVILRDQDGELEVLRDDDTLLRRPGSEVRTETFSDGSTRTTVTRSDGSKVVTIADASGRVLKRTRIDSEGREIVLIDDTEETVPVDFTRLPPPAPERRVIETTDRNALQAALRAESRARFDRNFTLRQVRQYREVRDLMPEINIDAINFRTGSAAIDPEEAEELLDLGEALSDFIRDNPDELFLIEGHTDAVGDAARNLALSDRRAESVALALTEYFGVPPENMIIQGYGESELLVLTNEAERANRRAVVRRVTPLLR